MCSTPLSLWKRASRDLAELHDFRLLCDGREFPCSRFVLGAASEVFRAMFAHGDTAEAERGAVNVEDSTPEAVGFFLDLLYTGRADVPADTARYS